MTHKTPIKTETQDSSILPDRNPINKSHQLLIEIGTEELPAKGLSALSQAFSERIACYLNKAELSFSQIQVFATPRRLGILVTDLATCQPDRLITKRGPAKAQAFDNAGNPTEVLARFAKACQVSPETLSIQETEKGAWVVLEQAETGKTAVELIPHIVQEALNTLPLPKRMRWNSFEESFLRPIHWVVLMLDNHSLPANYFHIPSGNQTRGHRFHCPTPIAVSDPKQYEAALYQAHVIADFQKRKIEIERQMQEVCQKYQVSVILDSTLLEEVTGLVEWPVVMLGTFAKEFLELPRELLITSMQTHQKCFALQDKAGKLLPQFLIVSNIASKDPNCVIQGNERVITARLADAIFYYRKDREASLESRRENLKQIVFQQGLGTLWDKCHRVSLLAEQIAAEIGANVSASKRAGELCKTDLLTQIVLEFPELQGIMAKYYAEHDREPASVGLAIQEHYHPRFAEDTLPASLEGIALSIADRIDTLVGLFGIGKRPSGDKDPFALRRQAFGMLRIMLEQSLKCDLLQNIQRSVLLYEQQGITLPSPDFVPELMDFCFERLRNFTSEVYAIPAKVFDAVLHKRPTSPYNFYRRLLAVNRFRSLKEAESLSEVNKRVKNILSKTQVPSGDIQPSLLQDPAEQALMTILQAKELEIAPLIQQEHYEAVLENLASLQEPVAAFFDAVMVMVEDTALRHNRLRLLNRLRALFLEVADISLL